MPHRHAVGERLAVGPAEGHPDAAAGLNLGGERLRHEVVERLLHALGQHDGGDRAATGIVLVPLGPALEELALRRMLLRHDPE